MEAAGKNGCQETEVRSALKEYGIEVPEDAEFEEMKDGNYRFQVHMLDTKGFYRPLYVFDVAADGREDTIIISAQR